MFLGLQLVDQQGEGRIQNSQMLRLAEGSKLPKKGVFVMI